MTIEEKLDAFITTTNERLSQLEREVKDLDRRLTISPEMKERLDAKFAHTRKLMEEAGYFQGVARNEI